jgi:hypothetical protein
VHSRPLETPWQRHQRRRRRPAPGGEQEQRRRGKWVEWEVVMLVARRSVCRDDEIDHPASRAADGTSGLVTC